MAPSLPESLNVQILGKDYRVSCPPGEQEALLRAARHLDEKMREIRDAGSIVGLERIAVMAALNLSHEVLSLTQQTASPETVAGLERLISEIDQELAAY